MDLTASLQADNTRLLASGFGIEVPELGAVSLQTRIRGSSERFELTEIDARTVQAEGLKIGLTGKIAFEQHPKSGLLGNMDLQARLDAPTMGSGPRFVGRNRYAPAETVSSQCPGEGHH